MVDFNIDHANSSRTKAIFDYADVVGVSVVGAPYFKQLRTFCRTMKRLYPTKPVLLGGQTMKAFSDEQFSILFGGTNAVLIKEDTDLAKVGIDPSSFSPALEVALQPFFEHMDPKRLRLYLSHEMPLVLSQGCHFRCRFCAAAKDQPEEFKDIASFTCDLLYVASKANEFGLENLEFYATNLDFFQTPRELEKYLRVIAWVRKETGVDIRVRALACMSSFLLADRMLSNLQKLLQEAGFYCVGFGVDGPTQEVWNGEGKTQNHESDIPKVLARTKQMGLRTEVLMIMGDQRYDLRLLLKTIHFCYGFVLDWDHVDLRLHVAKVLPGSEEWFVNSKYVNQILLNPGYGANLDVLALASPLTHPDRKQRWQVNAAYLAILLPTRWVGRCVSSTLFPQGGRGLLPFIARFINPHMPYDR